MAADRRTDHRADVRADVRGAGALQGNAAALWVGVFFPFAVTGFATFQVTYLAMPAEFTDDYRERTGS